MKNVSGSALVIQGLQNNSLVAGKSTALRLFPQSADTLSKISKVEAMILRPDGSRIFYIWYNTDFVLVPQSRRGPSVAVLVRGTLLPFVGMYYFRVNLIDSSGTLLESFVIDDVELLPTKDLRIIVSTLWSGTPLKPNEIDAAHEAMTRLATMFPVRDSVSSLDGEHSAGVRYKLDNNPIGPPVQDGHLFPLFDEYMNRPQGLDSIDAAISYRFPNAGEGIGANARPPRNGLPYSVIVWRMPLGEVFCQELGHGFGLESPDSPHYDGGGHSKDQFIDQAETELGFDIQYNQPLPGLMYDLMYGVAIGSATNRNFSLNSWDWEYLRKKFLALPSTGPSGPYVEWRDLQGHDLIPFPVPGKNADGLLAVFVLGSDRKLYYREEIAATGAWNNWSTLEGQNLQYPIAVANNANGRIQVFVRGGDNVIYTRTQTSAGGTWDPWTLIGGNEARAFDFVVGTNLDGRLEIVSIWNDGSLHTSYQTTPNGNWSGWENLGGHSLQPALTIGRNADGRLEAFVVGGDGKVYNKWQKQPNGRDGWGEWSSLAHPTLPSARDVTVERMSDGRLILFVVRLDGSVSYRAQVSPNSNWKDPVDLYGHSLKWPCTACRNPDGRVELFVVGGDGKIYNRWQVDNTRPDAWSNWASLGGQDINAGIGIVNDAANEIELFVVGGNRRLYQGNRPRAWF